MAEVLILSQQSYTTNNCTRLQIIDTSGLTSNAGDGSGKWGDVIDRSTITSATIQIVLPNGATLFGSPLDVTSTIQACTTNYIYFTPFTPSGTKFVDGIYSVIYTITSSSSQFVITNYFQVVCSYQCCVDSLWSNLPSKMCNQCDYQDYLNLCLEAESYLNALCTASCCGNTNAWNNISSLLNKICNINSNCNCS